MGLIDEDDYDKLQNTKHIFITNKNEFQCTKCGMSYSYRWMFNNSPGIPIWIVQGLSIGFALEHAECESETCGSENQDQPVDQKTN